MKRNMLTAAVMGVVAGISDTASGVSLNPDGLGQVLIYPYYTVNADNVTLLSVVNTVQRAKAVKVRFLEGYNGREVLDFTVFLSAYDVWTGVVFAQNASGGGNLLTDDESCTIPDIKGATGPGFGTLPDGRSYALFRSDSYQTDGGPQTLDRTREGHIELIELASVAAGSAIETAVSHVNNGIPPACTGLSALVTAHREALRRPSGGLFGGANIVNPGLGTLIGYNADAVDGFYQLNNTFDPTADNGPFLSDAHTTESTAVSYSYAATAVDGPNNLITSTYTSANAIDAVSSVFTANVISNEYVIETNSASESEWVVTFPTKSYYVNTTPAIAPFEQPFTAPGQSCVSIDISYNNREAGLLSSDCGFLGCPPVAPTLMCYETQVLTFQRAQDYTNASGVSVVLGSKLTMNLDPRSNGFSSGWLRLNLNPVIIRGQPQALRPSIEQHVFTGLPVTGFLATNYLNRNNGAPNVLATYSTASRHRTSRACVQSTTADRFCS